MKIEYSENFKRAVLALNESDKKQVKKQLKLMLINPRHPSLRSKKIQGTVDIFEASINMNIRMTWQYTKNGILLRNIGEHDKTLKNP